MNTQEGQPMAYLGQRQTEEGLVHVFTNGISIHYESDAHSGMAAERARHYFYGQ
jgi:hypothetical protein